MVELDNATQSKHPLFLLTGFSSRYLVIFSDKKWDAGEFLFKMCTASTSATRLELTAELVFEKAFSKLLQAILSIVRLGCTSTILLGSPVYKCVTCFWRKHATGLAVTWFLARTRNMISCFVTLVM